MQYRGPIDRARHRLIADRNQNSIHETAIAPFIFVSFQATICSRSLVMDAGIFITYIMKAGAGVTCVS
jgi:hypothetical protein